MVPTDVAQRFVGPFAPLLTSFTADGELDVDACSRELDALLASSIAGVSPGGSTGEGAALSDSELSTLVRCSKEKSGSRPVIAGVIRNSTRQAVQTAQAAIDAGADALMVTPTHYNVLVPDDEGNIDFYTAIAALGLPVIVYNVVPQNTIGPDVARRLMDVPNMLGIKQSVGGIQAMAEMELAISGVGTTFAATDEMLPTCYILGAQGAISAIVGLFPNVSSRVWQLVQDGKTEEALAIQRALYPVWQIIRGGQFPTRMKIAAKAIGRPQGYSRSPLRPSDSDLEQRILQALASAEAQIGPLN